MPHIIAKIKCGQTEDRASVERLNGWTTSQNTKWERRENNNFSICRFKVESNLCLRWNWGHLIVSTHTRGAHASKTLFDRRWDNQQKHATNTHYKSCGQWGGKIASIFYTYIYGNIEKQGRNMGGKCFKSSIHKCTRECKHRFYLLFHFCHRHHHHHHHRRAEHEIQYVHTNWLNLFSAYVSRKSIDTCFAFLLLAMFPFDIASLIDFMYFSVYDVDARHGFVIQKPIRVVVLPPRSRLLSRIQSIKIQNKRKMKNINIRMGILVDVCEMIWPWRIENNKNNCISFSARSKKFHKYKLCFISILLRGKLVETINWISPELTNANMEYDIERPSKE